MLKIYYKFKVLSIRVAMEYTINFWMMTLSGIVIPILFFIVTSILYQNMPSIGGWIQPELFLILGFIYASSGLVSILFDGVWHTTALVYSGKFDTILARPVSPLFQVLCNEIGLQGMGQLPTGLVTLGLAMNSLGILDLVHVGLALLFLACGTVFRMSTTLLFISSSFYIKSGIVNIPFLAHTLGEYARYPLEVYPVWMRAILLFVIPFGFVGYIPALILREINPLGLTAGLLIMNVVYFLLARAVFYRGIRRYESMGM